MSDCWGPGNRQGGPGGLSPSPAEDQRLTLPPPPHTGQVSSTVIFPLPPHEPHGTNPPPHVKYWPLPPHTGQVRVLSTLPVPAQLPQVTHRDPRLTVRATVVPLSRTVLGGGSWAQTMPSATVSLYSRPGSAGGSSPTCRSSSADCW